MYNIKNKGYSEHPKEYFIIDKNYSEHYTHANKNTVRLSGPLQSCEDSVCTKCSKYKGTNYMVCKKDCMLRNTTEIKACCALSCGNIKGITGKNDCLESCSGMQYL